MKLIRYEDTAAGVKVAYQVYEDSSDEVIISGGSPEGHIYLSVDDLHELNALLQEVEELIATKKGLSND